MMSSQSKVENGVIQSSIVLLQERFKEVQRVKEMRENRELHRVLSDYKNPSIISNNIIPSTAVSNITIKRNLSNPSDATMQCTDENDDDGELQIFIPPNYFGVNKRESSCYSSSSSITSTTTSTSSSSTTTTTNSGNNNHNPVNVNDVSLSLWPPTSYNNCNVGADYELRGASFEERLSRMRMVRPAVVQELIMNRPCVSSVSMFEDSHVSDVDTTLHL